MKIQIVLASLFLSLCAFGETSSWSFIKTSRGTDLEIKITKSLNPSAPFLIIAPGQSCNSKGPLFEMIEQEAAKKEINVVRFEWSYCSPSSTNKNPSDDLNTEVSDMELAISYAQDFLHKTNSDLLLAGKSLGSMVAFQIFKNHSDLKTLTLLTPVCSYSTDEQGNPLPAPQDVIEENYSHISSEQRPIFMISGNSDPLCNHAVLDQFKTKATDNLNTKYVEGNHSFTIVNSDGNVNQKATQNNLLDVADNMLQWFHSKI